MKALSSVTLWSVRRWREELCRNRNVFEMESMLQRYTLPRYQTFCFVLSDVILLCDLTAIKTYTCPLYYRLFLLLSFLFMVHFTFLPSSSTPSIYSINPFTNYFIYNMQTHSLQSLQKIFNLTESPSTLYSLSEFPLFSFLLRLMNVKVCNGEDCDVCR